ncbi:hypothetical protein JCM11491_000429 [Sporobolomyces phaffii]
MDDTLPIYYEPTRGSVTPDGRLSFPVSVHSLAFAEPHAASAASRASKRRSVMLTPASAPADWSPQCPPVVEERAAPPALPPRPRPPRPAHAPTPTPPPRLPTSSSSSSLHFGTHALSALNRGFKVTREWSAAAAKGKGKLVYPSPGPSPSAAPPDVDLPAVIFDVQVPRKTRVAFGTPLATLVATTHLAASLPPRPVSLSPITGDPCLLYLPAIAYRCLEYLSSSLGLEEEGIYRIPGRSQMVSQLRALFDSGAQGDDLRDLHQSRLDPNAVASCFKNWLRELPESLLSNELEAKIDRLTLDRLGYTASSAHFLSSTSPATSSSSPSTNSTPLSPPSTSSNSASTTASPNPTARTASIEYLEELSQLFADEMNAENFYLLRAISYHLALMASHSAKNKMTLTNLRLILSPTLRLSPGFLLVLVEEREIIFGGINQDARRRQGATSRLVTPPLLSIATFSPSNPGSTAGPRPPSPYDRRTPTPDPPPPRVTTPIADKFSHSAIPLAPRPPPPSLPQRPPPPPSGAATPAAQPSPSSSSSAPPPPALSSSAAAPPQSPPPLPRRRRADETEGFFSSRTHHHHPGRRGDVDVDRPVHDDSIDGRRESTTTTTTKETSDRERIKSADLKLELPSGFDDSIGLTGLGFGGLRIGERGSSGRDDGNPVVAAATSDSGRG